MIGYAHIYTAENFYSIIERSITGVYRRVSEVHLHRHLNEFDFNYNSRSKLGVEDAERAEGAVMGA